MATNRCITCGLPIPEDRQVCKACEDHGKPTADVVEVVRCKDCEHWGGVTFGYICRRFSGSYIRNETRENDFCSYGERKEDEGK